VRRTATRSLNPTIVHAEEADVVSFQVVDRTKGDGARGEWVSDLPGVIRPPLPWTVEVSDGGVWLASPDAGLAGR
jgi:hypothetical protein